MGYKLLSFFLLYCLSTQAQSYHKQRPLTFIVMEGKSMRVLSQHQPHQRLHPASLTKMMTLYCLFEAIERGKIKLNDGLFVSKSALYCPPSKLNLASGTSIKVRDAIYALITKSANDVAIVVAEALAGSEKDFVRIMNKKARSLGLRHTTFANASGLTHPQQLSTAKDMALLVRALYMHFPDYKNYFSAQYFQYKGKSYPNSNKLLRYVHGVNGVKTGYTTTAGFNLAASAERNNQWIIAVIMGCSSLRKRNKRVAQMIEESFSKMKFMHLGKSASFLKSMPALPYKQSLYRTKITKPINRCRNILPTARKKNLKKQRFSKVKLFKKNMPQKQQKRVTPIILTRFLSHYTPF